MTTGTTGRAMRMAIALAMALATVACEAPPREEESTPPAPPVSDEAVSGVTRGTRAQSGVIPLGVVAFDDFTLPLIHPEGRLVATQVGVAPLWSTALASPDSPVPDATSIEVRELLPGENPRLVHRIAPPILLGRSVDEGGFLVEQPRADGTRRIGYCDWASGTVVWLVDDEHVNAHATLGPRRQLAWSRRGVDAEGFDLAVLDETGERILRAIDDESWMMPEWSDDGATLFALRLRDGVLQATSMSTTSVAAMRQSLRTLELTNRGTPFIAFQTLAPRVGAVASRFTPRNAWVLFHPVRSRMAIWTPRDGRVQFLHAGSFSMAMLDGERALVALPSRVVVERLADGNVSPTLLQGPHAIRSVRNQPWPIVLLRPEEGSVGITGLIPLSARAD